MYLFQLTLETMTLCVFVTLILKFLKNFNIRNYTILMLISPLFLFFIGFSLRLTDIQDIIDMGFFFTEFSLLFVYLLFAICLCLGQLKYWKVK